MKDGWEMKTLGDLFDITSSKRVFESDWKSTGVPFYRAREIVKLAKYGYVENDLFISDEMFDRYSNKYGVPKAGDIMVTGVGTLGVCHVVRDADRFYFKDGNIIWLKRKTNTISRFVEYAFQASCLRSQINDSKGATVGTYTIIKAKSTRIPLPPLAEQQRIVAVLDEAFARITAARASTEKCLSLACTVLESHTHFLFGDTSWHAVPLASVATLRNGVNYTKRSKGCVIKVVGVKDFQDNFTVPFENLAVATLARIIHERSTDWAQLV